MTHAGDKASLRRAMRAVLSNLDRRWVKAASSRVCENLIQHLKEMPNIDHVLAWASFFAGEVDLAEFIEAQLEAGRRVYLPQTRENRTMQFVAVNDAWIDDAVLGQGGVPEPRPDSGQVYDTHHAANTLVVVPGLAFDQRGGRLGRGMGYYDKFLARSLMHSARVVGAGWELQIVPEVPMAAHDQALEQLVTEQRILNTNSTITL